jgi:RNA polymerase primary sigma factor
MANPAKNEEQAPAAETTERDSPLLDLSDQSVKKLLKSAKARGYVTLDQLNSVLPSEEVSPDQIEDTMAMLSDMGINVVETEESDEPQEAEATDTADEEDNRAGPTASSRTAGGTTAMRAQEARPRHPPAPRRSGPPRLLPPPREAPAPAPPRGRPLTP